MHSENFKILIDNYDYIWEVQKKGNTTRLTQRHAKGASITVTDARKTCTRKTTTSNPNTSYGDKRAVWNCVKKKSTSIKEELDFTTPAGFINLINRELSGVPAEVEIFAQPGNPAAVGVRFFTPSSSIGAVFDPTPSPGSSSLYTVSYYGASGEKVAFSSLSQQLDKGIFAVVPFKKLKKKWK
jgi:hypothetical protein